MNSSLAPLGPRTRNSLISSCPAVAVCASAGALISSAALARLATHAIRHDLRIVDSTFRSKVDRSSSAYLVGSGSGERLDVQVELVTPRLLDAEQEAHVDRRAIGE